mmetsp:Transcript_9894/g.26088  ORF Transcript_9894/g.26088 Transcript_9894/m.26088 type:complete len:207 (+) Transcript_9894:543-1163(+)
MLVLVPATRCIASKNIVQRSSTPNFKTSVMLDGTDGPSHAYPTAPMKAYKPICVGPATEKLLMNSWGFRISAMSSKYSQFPENAKTIKEIAPKNSRIPCAAGNADVSASSDSTWVISLATRRTTAAMVVKLKTFSQHVSLRFLIHISGTNVPKTIAHQVGRHQCTSWKALPKVFAVRLRYAPVHASFSKYNPHRMTSFAVPERPKV